MSVRYATEAVVLGLDGPGLGVARSLGRHGIPVVAVAHAPHPALSTRHARVVQTRAPDPDALVEDLVSLGRTLEARSPLFLCGDEPVRWLSPRRSELEPWFHLPLPAQDVVDLFIDKTRFTTWAERGGWPVPATRVVRSPEEVERAISELPLPLILKPATRNYAYRRRSLPKAFIASTPEELRAAYARIAAAEPEAVVQRFVPGGDDRIAFCLGYAPAAGGPPVLFVGRKLLQWPPGCGITAVAEPAPEAWRRPLSDLLERLWEEVSYRGPGSLECKMEPATDRPFITEPTVGRMNVQSEIAPLNGVNIPLRMYCDLLGLPVPEEPQTPGATKLVFGRSLRSSLAAYRAQDRGERPSLAALLGGRVRYALFRLDDPGPGLSTVRRGVVRLVRDAARRIGIGKS